MTERPKVSVIIVSYQSVAELSNCLASLRMHVRDSEVIVVDNASTDGTVAMIRRDHPDVVVIANDSNAGFSRGNNQGIAIARGQYLLFLNPDTEVRPEAVDRLIEVLEQESGCVATGPRLINPDGSVWRECARRLPTLWTELCWMLRLDVRFPRSRLFAWKYYAPWDRLTDRVIEGLVGAAMVCRRSDLDRIGGFDESVPLFLDDIDLCCRLSTLGYLRYVTNAHVMHIHDVSAATQPRLLIQQLGLQARYVYFMKHRGAPTARVFQALVTFVGTMSVLLAIACHLAGLKGRGDRAATRARACLGWVGSDKRRVTVLPTPARLATSP